MRDPRPPPALGSADLRRGTALLTQPPTPMPPAPAAASSPPGPLPPGQATETSRNEAAMAHLLWRGVPQLLAVLDPDGRLRATNPAWQHVLGLEAQRLRGQPLADLVHAEDRPGVQRQLQAVARSGAPAGFSARLRCADGSHRRIDWTLSLRDGLACAAGTPAAHGTPMAAPAPPGSAATPPPPAVAAQARQQTLRTVARLTSGLSHDFNNLLQVLRNALELIQQRPNEPRQVAAWAGSALRIVDHGAQLTAQLLAFAGTQRLEPQTVHVGMLLRGLQERLQRLLGPGVQLQLDLPAGNALAIGDAAQLELSLLNLAANAADAMPQGGQLTITCGRAHVEEDAELATGDYISLQVSDTGSGMSDVVRERAFEPFFTTKALGQGSGLGLSQVYGFVQQMGGAVRIGPGPGGRGNSVCLLLPAVAPAPPAAAAAAQPAGKASQPLQPRVLVVVDDADRRQLLRSALNLLGYDRVQAVGANTARQLIEQQPPDVVVLGLPARPVGPDELARRARRLRPGVGVVRLDSVATAPQLPVDIDALAQAIRRAVAPPRT